MTRSTDDLDREPRGWNVWLTLMVLAIAFTIGVAVLDYLGLFADLGIALRLVGLAVAIGFGLGGSSQRTVELIRFDLRGVRRDLARLGDDLGRLQETTSRGFAATNRALGDIAGGLADLNRGVAEVSRGVGEVSAGMAAVSHGVAGATRGIEEVARLLRERLPRT